MPKKKEKTKEQKEAEVLNGFESWLEKRPVKEARAQAGDVAEDEGTPSRRRKKK